jgi:hypothetical protein
MKISLPVLEIHADGETYCADDRRFNFFVATFVPMSQTAQRVSIRKANRLTLFMQIVTADVHYGNYMKLGLSVMLHSVTGCLSPTVSRQRSGLIFKVQWYKARQLHDLKILITQHTKIIPEEMCSQLHRFESLKPPTLNPQKRLVAKIKSS